MTPFLWILAGGFILGIVLLFIFNAAKKPVGILVGILLSLACAVFFVVDITVEPVKNPSAVTEDSNELSDAEWEQVQAVFLEATGKELEYKPVYCGEWREGRQYKTENYAYGQYLINMDDDGYVHLVVWVQDKAGSEGRTVMYNRLEDENVPPMEETNE